MSQGRVIITGPGGGAANRLEIHDFVKNDKFLSLFVQALQRMYANDQVNPQSFFQIGGIHGLPYVAWDGATANPPVDPNAQWAGYCTHGSTLFPTWHRPYVLLIEQTLQKHAIDIAATYTVNKDDWTKAAQQMRLPYWDWAFNSIPPDEVIALDKISITTPDGKKTSIDNPLRRYRFHPIDPSFPSPYDRWQTTLRWPTSDAPNATDNVNRLRSVLRSVQSDVTTKTYNLLTRVHTWPAFSNHTPGDGGSSSNSLEAIHDGIHVDVGGNGQMADPSVAAFDPIFFLHHCNVDRMLSLWSALNPTVWVSPGDSEAGTFTLPPEAPVDRTTPLTPFWNTQDTFWASAAVTDTAKLGYTYPEFNGLDMGNQNAVRTAIANAVNRLYGRRVFSGFPSLGSFAAIPSAPKPQGRTAHTSNDESSATGTLSAAVQNVAAHVQDAAAQVQATFQTSVQHSHPGSTHTDGNMWEWTARVQVKKYELKTSFSVILFLGQVPEDPQQWLVAPNFVGAHHAFVNSSAERCENCRTQQDLVLEGFVHLNIAISKLSGLNSFEPDVVDPYLKRELHWAVLKMDGTPAQLESLEVTVIATELTLPPGAMFPVPSQVEHHHGITHGRRGGSRHA